MSENNLNGTASDPVIEQIAANATPEDAERVSALTDMLGAVGGKVMSTEDFNTVREAVPEQVRVQMGDQPPRMFNIDALPPPAEKASRKFGAAAAGAATLADLLNSLLGSNVPSRGYSLREFTERDSKRYTLLLAHLLTAPEAHVAAHVKTYVENFLNTAGNGPSDVYNTCVRLAQDTCLCGMSEKARATIRVTDRFVPPGKPPETREDDRTARTISEDEKVQELIRFVLADQRLKLETRLGGQVRELETMTAHLKHYTTLRGFVWNFSRDIRNDLTLFKDYAQEELKRVPLKERAGIFVKTFYQEYTGKSWA